MYIQHNITNIVFIFFSKTLGLGVEYIPVRSSISDQYYFYAKYDKNASTRACFLKLLRERPRGVARCVTYL